MTLLRYCLIVAGCQLVLAGPLAAQTDAAKAKAEAAKTEAEDAAKKAAAAAKTQAATAKTKATAEADKAKAEADKAKRKLKKGQKKARHKLKKAKKKLGKGKAKAKDAAAESAADQAKAKEKLTPKEQAELLKPLNMLKFTIGLGIASISSSPDGEEGVDTEFDAKGHSLVGIAYDLGAFAFAGLHPFVYYNYVPIDIVVKAGPRTFRGVWHSHQLGAEGHYRLSGGHGMVAGVGLTSTVTELGPSDLIEEEAPSELLANQLGFHVAVGYEYALMESFRLGAKFSATFGTIGYSSALLYSSFLL